MHSKILNAAKEIQQLLDFLIPDDSAKVAEQLKELLELANEFPDDSAISHDIITLLSAYPETKAWLDNKLTQKSTTRGSTTRSGHTETTRSGG